MYLFTIDMEYPGNIVHVLQMAFCTALCLVWVVDALVQVLNLMLDLLLGGEWKCFHFLSRSTELPG